VICGLVGEGKRLTQGSNSIYFFMHDRVKEDEDVCLQRDFPANLASNSLQLAKKPGHIVKLVIYLR
jgi:hypothetical protein